MTASTPVVHINNSARLAYELINSRIERQRDQIDKLDNKAAAVLTWGGLLLGVVVTVLATGFANHRENWLILVRLVVLLLMMYFYARIAWSFRSAYRIRKFHLTPKPTPLLKWRDVPEEETMRAVTDQMAKNFDDNEPLVDKKADCIEQMIAFLSAEALALIPTLAFLALT